MRKNHVFIITITIIFIVVLFGLLNIPQTARSQGAMPGSGPLENESDATAVARTVAIGNSTNRELSQVTFETIRKIGPTELKEILNADGTITDLSVLLETSPAEEFSKIVWVVTFRGSFVGRNPPGVKPSIYSVIDVFLDARDGSVIGIRLFR
jgi:hypothetical protein